jgi:hypothetical protein
MLSGTLADPITSTRFDSRTWSGLALAVILIASFLLKLHNLDHRGLKGSMSRFTRSPRRTC